jgi:hypothetical protein
MTPAKTAYARSAGHLHGFAKMMCSGGTPIASVSAILRADAQSKPPAAQRRERAHDHAVGVALDGVEGGDARHRLRERLQLVTSLAVVGDQVSWCPYQTNVSVAC